MKKIQYHLVFTLVLITLLPIDYSAVAQEVVGLSIGYEHFPSAELATPLQGAPGLEIETSSKYITAMFPLSFKDGKISVSNKFNYKKVSFEYKNFPANGNKIEQAQYVDYSIFMIDSLNAKWKLAVMVNPILASDFESDISKDDFIIGGIVGLIRTTSEKLDWGFGLAYMSDFGNPIPLPFLYIDWKPTPNMIVNGIIPSNLLIGRRMTDWFDLGIELSVDGNRFHGSPSKFGTEKPFMRYSEGTLSSLARLHISSWLHLNIYGGWGFFRNFEFYEDQIKQQSFDLNRVGYFSTQLILGF